MTSEQAIEETDGFLNDTILTVVKIIADLLKNNIESLKLPTVLKTALKKLKSLFTKIKVEETEIKLEVIENEYRTFSTDRGDHQCPHRGERRTMIGLE